MKRKGLMMATMAVALAAGVLRAADVPPEGLKVLMDAYNEGVKQMAAGKTDDARAAFEAVIRDAAASKEAQAATLLASAANNLGTILLQQGKSKEALAAYERSVKADPSLGTAANNLARLLIQIGEDRQAAGLLAKNLKVSQEGKHESLLLTAGILCRAKADTAKQDAVWDALFKETDKSTAAREKLLAELMLNGADALALRKTEEGLAADPAWTAGQALKARLTAKAGKTLDALKQFRALVKSDPKDASLRSDLLVLLIEKELLDEAKEQAEAAVKAFPQNSALWFMHGSVLEQLGNSKEAEKSYYTATTCDKSNEKAWNNLGLLVEKRGDAKTAVACYSTAMKINPRSPRTLYNLGRLYVTEDIDFKTGVRMLDAAASLDGEGAAEAKKLLDSLAATAKKDK
jgi:tetratricopeptide (TPR) repeat protein